MWWFIQHFDINWLIWIKNRLEGDEGYDVGERGGQHGGGNAPVHGHKSQSGQRSAGRKIIEHLVEMFLNPELYIFHENLLYVQEVVTQPKILNRTISSNLIHVT